MYACIAGIVKLFLVFKSICIYAYKILNSSKLGTDISVTFMKSRIINFDIIGRPLLSHTH